MSGLPTEAERFRRQRARTPEQKREVIERLCAVWNAFPELRLGQLLSNVLSDAYPVQGPELFHVEDRQLANDAEEYARRWVPKEQAAP